MKKLFLILFICSLFSLGGGWGHQKPPLGIKIDWSNPITEGLVGCWVFNEGSGCKVYDLSGNNNHGTKGATSSDFDWHPGKTGFKIKFNGTNNYFDCGNNQSLDAIEGVTVEALVYTLASGWRGIVYKFNGSFSNYHIGVNPNGYLGGGCHDGSWHTVQASGGTRSLINKWRHVALVIDWNNDFCKLYVDGQLEAQDLSFTYGNGINAVSPTIGKGSGSEYFSGYIEGVRIYNRSLSAAEIQRLYIEPYGMFKKEKTSLWEKAGEAIAKTIQPIINIF